MIEGWVGLGWAGLGWAGVPVTVSVFVRLNDQFWMKSLQSF